MEKIKIAKIVKVTGIKGEVKLYNYSDYKERFEELNKLIISGGRDGDLTLRIEKVRYQGEMVIIKFEGVNDRNQAEKLRDRDVYITENDLRELPEDTYYLRDLIGMRVVDDGTYGEIGVLKDVIQNSAQDIYVVSSPGGREVLIPAVRDFIREIDTEARVIHTALIPGFIDGAIEA